MESYYRYFFELQGDFIIICNQGRKTLPQTNGRQNKPSPSPPPSSASRHPHNVYTAQASSWETCQLLLLEAPKFVFRFSHRKTGPQTEAKPEAPSGPNVTTSLGAAVRFFSGNYLRNMLIPKNNSRPVLGLGKEAENPKPAGRLRFLRDGQVPPGPAPLGASSSHTQLPGRLQPDSLQRWLGLDKTRRQ